LARAGAVVDDDLLAPRFGELLPTMRASRSFGPLGGKRHIRRIGRSGKPAAAAGIYDECAE